MYKIQMKFHTLYTFWSKHVAQDTTMVIILFLKYICVPVHFLRSSFSIFLISFITIQPRLLDGPDIPDVQFLVPHFRHSRQPISVKLGLTSSTPL